jgi:hypothetical protein
MKVGASIVTCLMTTMDFGFDYASSPQKCVELEKKLNNSHMFDQVMCSW